MSEAVSSVDLTTPEVAEGNYHMQVKVGVAEFNCQGPARLVREDYMRFLDLIDRVGSQAIQSRVERTTPIAIEASESSDIEESTWSKAFRRKDDRLSLNMLPESQSQNGDALLLIMYGYQTLYSLEGVTSIMLLESAKQSGLRIDRIDRSLTADHNKLVLKGGSGKGTRYSLNNRGLAYAQELLERMFE